MSSEEFLTIPKMLQELKSWGLKRSESWARKQRMKGTGPKSVKIGITVLYPRKDLRMWFESSLR